MTPEEQEYNDKNFNINRDVAYAINNNQMSVQDVSADFPVELLSKEKQAEHAAFHSKKKTKKEKAEGVEIEEGGNEDTEKGKVEEKP